MNFRFDGRSKGSHRIVYPTRRAHGIVSRIGCEAQRTPSGYRSDRMLSARSARVSVRGDSDVACPAHRIQEAWWRLQTLTCFDCNSGHGTTLDGQLIRAMKAMDSIEGTEPIPTIMSNAKGRIASDLLLPVVAKTSPITVQVIGKASSPAATEDLRSNLAPGFELTLHMSFVFIPERYWRAVLRSAYLAKNKRKRTPKTILKLPDLEQSKSAVLNSLTSRSSRRSYDPAIREVRLVFNKTVVTRYRIYVEEAHYASSTVNLRLTAIRRLAYKAADCGLLSPHLVPGIRPVKGVKKHRLRIGNWLTAEQGKRLLAVFDDSDFRGKSDYAMVAVLLCCRLRRAQLAALAVGHLQ